MTVEEIMRQVRVLSLEEKKRLIAEIVDTIAEPKDHTPDITQQFDWGKQLNELLDSLDLSDWDSEVPIEEWLKARREEQLNRYRNIWDEQE